MWRKTVPVGLILLSLSSAAYSLDPVGPPQALLGQGHWSLGVEYAYSETAFDLMRVATAMSFATSSVDLKANRAYANLRYGLWKNVDVFARLGAGTFEVPDVAEGEPGFAWGLGAAATVYDTDKFDWGLLVQFSNGRFDPSDTAPAMFGPSATELWSLQVVTGPTYHIRDNLAVYGGVFYHLLLGEYELSGPVRRQEDIKENNPVGGLLGLDWALKENVHWTAEFQYAGPTFAVATGLRWVLN